MYQEKKQAMSLGPDSSAVAETILQHFTIIPQMANRTLLFDFGNSYKTSQILTSAECESSIYSEYLCILNNRLKCLLCA